MFLKEGTAATIKLGPFVDDSDGKTAETGLTIKKANVRLSKNGGDMAAASADQGTSDAGAAHDELGYYDISLDADDTDTPGRLRVMATMSGALPVWQDFIVLPALVYARLIADDQAIDELHVIKAMVANKSEYTVSTGVMVVKDDDGTTTLKTLTPSEEDGVRTLTPS